MYKTTILSITFLTILLLLTGNTALASTLPGSSHIKPYTTKHSPPEPEVSNWSMAGANPQRTSWVPEEVNPGASSQFGVEWYRPIEAYIGQHVQLVAARDKIYVSSARGVYALNAATGNEVWRFDTEMPIGHSPTVVENILYVGGFDKRVYALHADTGALIWTFDGAKGGFSTNPLVVEGKVLLGSRDGYFYALDQYSGDLLWQYPAKGQTPLGPILYSAAYKNGRVFFAANDNHAYAVDVNTGVLLWKSQKMPGDGYQAWWPVIYGNYVIFSGALAYAEEAFPGTTSVRNVVDENDPYYAQMHQFQYSTDFVKTLQRDDVFHNGEAGGSKLGPEFQSGSSQDTAGIQWLWGNGKTVVNAAKVTQYLENDGQIKVNRPTNKPWRRSVIVLNTQNGAEYTFDTDHDGRPEYAPFMLTGTKSGNRYPPLIIPTKTDSGITNEVMYTQNFDTYASGWQISRAKFTGWQWGTPYIYPVGNSFAIDEPLAGSAGGSILFENLCCDREAHWVNLQTGQRGTFWDYNRTLESIKRDKDEIEYWMKSYAPGYDEMWWGASMYDNYPRLYGNYGTMNGIYHNHGLQNPIIPYNGRLFVHRSNAIIALGPNAVSLRQMNASETPEEYENNIRQEYPYIFKSLLKIDMPDQNLTSTLTMQDIEGALNQQIYQMLETGHLQPGYYNGTRGYSELANYFENPGDTLSVLVRVYPHVSDTLKPDLEKYIKQHYQLYFENEMYARTGFWRDMPGTYDLNNPTDFGQLQPRGWLPLPPEVIEDIKTHKANTYPNWEWPWSYPQHNFYAMWQFAQTFYSDNPAKVKEIYRNAKSKLETTPPDTNVLHKKPWLHNAYIAGYIGFLELQALAGETANDSSLRTTVQTQLNNLLALRANDFRKDQPWPDGSQPYKGNFNIARNFIYMTPELGDHLHNNAFNKVKEAVDEYHWVAPYWVATRYEASQGEFANDNLYTHSSMFLAKAYILQEPVDQLLKYIDSPAFETGDLFYIQNLAIILENATSNFSMNIEPVHQVAGPGDTVQYTIKIQSYEVTPVSLSTTPVSPDLAVNLSASSIAPPGETTLVLNTPSGTIPFPGVKYTIPVTATRNGVVKTSMISLDLLPNDLSNVQKIYLPLLMR